jgi:hypothetical protein
VWEQMDRGKQIQAIQAIIERIVTTEPPNKSPSGSIQQSDRRRRHEPQY